MKQVILDQATQEERVALISKALQVGYTLHEYDGPTYALFSNAAPDTLFQILEEDIEYMHKHGMIERDRAN